MLGWQVLMSDITDDDSGKYLKVKYIQKKSVTVCEAPFLFDKGSSITWVPNTDKLTTTAPGVKFASYDDEWFGQPVSVVEMDGKVRQPHMAALSPRSAYCAPPVITLFGWRMARRVWLGRLMCWRR